MPDYLADLREIVRRGQGSELKRNLLLKWVNRLELDWKRAGVDVNSSPQERLCKALGRSDDEAREWMFKLCLARLSRSEFSDWTGWEFRNNWAQGSYSAEIPNKRWRLEPAKSIAILCEQGIGDEVMFASCLPDLKKLVPDILYECDPRLVEVIKRSFGIRAKGREDIEKKGEPVIQYLTAPRPEDYFLPAGDLPRLFRKKLSDFHRQAYLVPLPEKVEKWSHLKGRVGLGWRSRTGQIKPADFGVENPVCLQYDHWPYEVEGMEVPDCDLRNDIEDILGICANLSKVVSVPQTICHFAGSVGTPVEVVIPPFGSSRINDQFRYRYVNPMPWYPNVKVYENLNAYRRKDG